MTVIRSPLSPVIFSPLRAPTTLYKGAGELFAQTIGRSIAPVAGAGAASPGVYAHVDAVRVSGSLRTIRVWARAAGTLIVAAYKRSSTANQLVKQRGFSVAVSVGLNNLSVGMAVNAGELIGFTVTTGVLAYSSATADGAGWFFSGSSDPATWTDAVVERALRLEIGFDLYAEPQALQATMPVASGWNHVLAYGQSNSNGGLSGAVLNDTPSATHLTFDVGPKAAPAITGGNNPAAGTKAMVEDDVSPINGTTGSVYKDTGLWQFGEEFTTRHADTTLFLSTAGVGGGRLNSITASAPWYQAMTYHVTQAKAYADAAEVSYGVSAVLFDHGETDQADGTITKAKYKEMLLVLIDAFNNEVRAITGQAARPQWLFTTTPYSITVTDAPTEAINEICSERVDCHLVAPGYRFAHGNDDLHLTAVGQCVKRAFQARAAAALADGDPVPAIRWLGATGAGTDSVVVQASSPTPLEINTTLVAAVPNSGFAVSDSGGAKTITNVALGTSVLDPESGLYLTDITLTLSTSLGATPIVKYAKTAIGSSPEITNGAAGNIFDTTDDDVTVDGSPYSMAHAAPPMTLVIGV